jgi:hypothetical protein
LYTLQHIQKQLALVAPLIEASPTSVIAAVTPAAATTAAATAAVAVTVTAAVTTAAATAAAVIAAAVTAIAAAAALKAAPKAAATKSMAAPTIVTPISTTAVTAVVHQRPPLVKMSAKRPIKQKVVIAKKYNQVKRLETSSKLVAIKTAKLMIITTQV